MNRDQPGPVLWDAKVQRLIKNLPPAATLSPAQLDRIERGLLSGPAPRRSKAPALVFAAALLVVGVLLSLRHEKAQQPPSLVVPAGSLTKLARQGAQLAVVGPATVANLDSATPRMYSGRLLVRSGDQPVIVDVPEGSVRLQSRASVVIEVRSAHTRVASYAGTAQVQWQAFGHSVEIGEGTQLDMTGVTVAPAAERSEIDSLLRAEPPAEAVRPAPSAASVDAPSVPTHPYSNAPKPKRDESKAIPPEPLSPEPSASAPPTEAQTVGEALKALRTGHPEVALSALNDYRGDHPSGKLLPEADAVSIEALLALDRRGDALARLDGMALGSYPNADRLSVLRGELRSEKGRCSEALGDFAQSLDITDSTLRARALYGRASCRAQLGDSDGARADFSACASADPSGRWGEAARRALRR
jgi:hypothetical protein